MIEKTFAKPLESDTLTREVIRTVTREVQEQEPMCDAEGILIEYKTVTKTVTEEVPEQEEYPNSAPNTYKKYREAAEWCNANGAQIVDCGDYYEVQAIPEPSKEEQEAALQKHYTNLIQHILDVEARKLGYDNCNSVCTYVNTGVQKFDDEGVAFRKWRSAVWAKGYEILADVQSGKMEIPTEEELVALLPALEIVYTEAAE